MVFAYILNMKNISGDLMDVDTVWNLITYITRCETTYINSLHVFPPFSLYFLLNCTPGEFGRIVPPYGGAQFEAEGRGRYLFSSIFNRLKKRKKKKKKEKRKKKKVFETIFAWKYNLVFYIWFGVCRLSSEVVRNSRF